MPTVDNYKSSGNIHGESTEGDLPHHINAIPGPQKKEEEIYDSLNNVSFD